MPKYRPTTQLRPDNRPGGFGIHPPAAPVRKPRPNDRPGPYGAAPTAPQRRPPPGIPDLPPGRHPGGPPGVPPVAPQQPYGGTSIEALLAGYPQPRSDADITAQAHGMLDPLVAQLAAQINARAAAGSEAIRGSTSQIAQDLGQYAGSAANIFGQAQQSQAASDAALAAKLQGGGQEQAAGLSSRLAGIGNGSDPAVAAAAAAAAQTGTGASNALYGKGSASLSDLISQGAQAQQYAAKLPGLAEQGGLQTLGQFQGQLGGELASGTQDILNQLPGIVQQFRTANDQRTADLADARTSLTTHLADRQQQQQQFQQQQSESTRRYNAGLQSDQARSSEARREFNVTNREKLLLAKMATETDTAKAQQDWDKFVATQKEEDARQAQRENAQNQRANLSQSGLNQRATFTQQNENQRQQQRQANENQRNQARIRATNQRAAAARAVRAAKQAKMTPVQLQKVKATAGLIADNAFTGFTDKAGKDHPKISAAAALREMRQEGIPDAIAVPAINRAYGTNFNPKGALPNPNYKPGG
jgi:hypothetical protein